MMAAREWGRRRRMLVALYRYLTFFLLTAFLVTCCMLVFLNNLEQDILLTEAGISPEMFLLPVLSALLALTGITGFGELAKCFSCRMAELEQSCYLNLRQLMMVRMAITGAVNLLFLGCFIGISQGRLQAGLIRISLYLMTPYVCNMLLFFTAFTFMRSGRKLFQVSVLLAAGFLSFLPMLFPGLYGKAAVGLWAAVLLGAAALMAAQMLYLTKELDRGEKICWN